MARLAREPLSADGEPENDDERDEVLAGTSWVPPLHQQGAAVSREVEGRHARGPAEFAAMCWCM